MTYKIGDRVILKKETGEGRQKSNVVFFKWAVVGCCMNVAKLLVWLLWLLYAVYASYREDGCGEAKA